MNGTADIRDIAPPVEVFPYPLWMVVAAAAVVALVLALAVWLLVRLLRRRPAPVPLPHEIALAALQLAREQLSTLDPYAFSIRVSDILRDYLVAKFDLPARLQTSDEFLRTLENFAKFSSGTKLQLAQFLAKCDLIKFARINATRADSEALLDQALLFVKESAGIESKSSTERRAA